MVRSHWIGPAALVLAWAGLAGAQGFAPAQPADGHTDRFLSVQEVGRPPLRCKLLKSWYEPDGSRAFQVQAVSTGEMISIFEAGPKILSPAEAMSKPAASRIVHWGPAGHPPAGTPEAPKDATVYGWQSTGAPQLRNPSETVQPYAAKAPPGGWPAAYAGPPPPKVLRVPASPPVQAVQTPAAPQPPSARPEEKAAKKVPPAVAVKVPPASAAPAPIETKPLPTATSKAPPAGGPAAIAEKPPAAGAGDPAVSKWSPVPTPLPSAHAPPSAAIARVAAPAKLDATVSVKTADAAKPAEDDWHQSWGKVAKPKSPLVASAAPPSPPPTPAKVDPLLDPESYSRVKTDQLISRRFKEKGVAEQATLPSKELPRKDAPPRLADVAAVEAKQTVPSAPAVKKPEQVPAPPPPVLAPTPPPPAPRPGPVLPVSSAPPAQTVHPPQLTPPPPAQSAAEKSLPPYISAATAAAADAGDNAFSAPRPAPKSNAGNVLAAQPPGVSMMPGYSGASSSDCKWMQIPAAPPVIAAAPSAGVVAAGYPVAARPAVPAAAAEVVPLQPGLSSSELLMTLQTSLYPSQREWAVDRLTACDWHADPRVVDGLAKAAHTDPAPLVRAGCLRALARMRAACEPALAAAKDLKADADQRVRQEAEATMGVLQAAAHPVRLSD